MEQKIAVANGTELRFENIGGSFTVVRTLKDKWGNEMGQRLVNQNGKEFDLRNVNGEVCLSEANEIIHNPKPTGEISERGESEWFAYEVGGYTITA